MQAGRVPGKRGVLASMPAGNVLFPALLMKEGLKPSLATTHAKASERVIADPLGWEDGKNGVTRTVATLRLQRQK